MAKIKIYGDVVKGCIFFDGSTVEPKFLGTVLAEIKADETDRVVIYRTDRQDSLGNNRQLFKRINPVRIQNEEAVDLMNGLNYSIQDVVDYINGQSNLTASVNPVIDTSLNGEELGFTLDATSTSIIFDNGYQYGVNTIKALDTGDGLITIKSIEDARVHFTELDHTMVDINGSDAVGGLNDVINALNELFTVGAFEQIVISDPYSTMVADVDGVDAGYTLEGVDAVDPIGDDIFSYDGVGYANYAGLKSVETIDQAGEYYTFDIRGEGTIGFGLVHTQASYDAGLYSGNASYADPASFAAINSAHYGMQFSHWFHPTPNGSWTNYGANTGYSMRAGWSNFNGTDEQADWLAGNPIKVRVGIDNNSYISIETLRNGTDWVVHARSSYPVPQGSSYHLGVKSQSASARVFSAPKVHLLEEVAPTMYFRYIESPDGVFHYPLFATAEEAEYYDEIHNGLTAGTGSSHTHTYNDDPTNTTWYMPEASHDPTNYSFSVAPSATTFNGNAVTYTEVTSLTNASFVPSQFSSTDYTYQEGTAVNLQVTPQGASWSTSVSITPSGSGLVYDGYSLIQGTLADVAADTIYTVSVTRANSYGSTIGTFEIQATNVAPVQTMLTSWNKALDFSGGSEYAKQVSNYSYTNALSMGFTGTTVPVNTIDVSKTSNHFYSRPWAISTVFKLDGNNSNQHIWNYGEGASSTADNIYLRTDQWNALYFGWGRDGAKNEYLISTNLGTAAWYGIYIAHKGARYSSSDATAANLASQFDIKLMFYSGGSWIFNPNPTYGGASTWVTTGARMDRAVGGHMTIGGRGANRNFHGKVASMVVTTLVGDRSMPTTNQIEKMVTDPQKWLQNFKVGNEYRIPSHQYPQTGSNSFAMNGTNENTSTQVWLMGDGTYDSYSNGIRNEVKQTDQNLTKLQLNSMVSNDIETVNIAGLT